MMFWSANFPIDLIKTRLQINRGPLAGRGLLDVAVHIIRNEGGWRGLYRGLAPCLLRAGPANAVCFGAFEASMSLLKPDR